MAVQSDEGMNEDRSEETPGRPKPGAKIDPETRMRFKTGFERLPQIQREIYLAHCRDELSYDEIAALMQVSEAFVERQLAKAIYKLMKAMDGEKRKWWERWF